MRFLFALILFPFFGIAQFAPPAGQAGTSAVYKDSAVFINWASACRVTRGLQDISNSASGYPTVGDSSKAIGIADNSIVSLGDGGSAICTFQHPLTDGSGPDFAVFENSFSDDYLEFGFVEVSSDGVNFFRFAPTSNIEDTAQTASFGTCDASLVNNLAGKYRVLYGTPFDLQELAGTPGLDISNITHVKIIDVVGSISSTYATYDKNSHKVNDPWPTAFASGGFDLDAIGVIHDITNSISEEASSAISVFPNPASSAETINISCMHGSILNEVSLTTMEGNVITVVQQQSQGRVCLQLASLPAGIYILHVKLNTGLITKKLIIHP